MIKNYLLIAWRQIIKNKLYSSINILGLVVGLAVYIFGSLLARHALATLADCGWAFCVSYFFLKSREIAA